MLLLVSPQVRRTLSYVFLSCLSTGWHTSLKHRLSWVGRTCQDHQVQFLAIHRTISGSHTICPRIYSVLGNTAKNQDLVKSKWVLMQTMLIKGILLHLLTNKNKIKVDRLFNPWLFCDTSIHDYKAVIQLKILYQTDLPTAFLWQQHHKKNFSQHFSLTFLRAHR